jgi:hypothetical protein
MKPSKASDRYRSLSGNASCGTLAVPVHVLGIPLDAASFFERGDADQPGAIRPGLFGPPLDHINERPDFKPLIIPRDAPFGGPFDQHRRQ